MSELQIGLLAIGLLVLVLVLGYNKIQEIRHRRSADRAFGKAHDDVLMQSSHSGATVPADAVEPKFPGESCAQAFSDQIPLPAEAMALAGRERLPEGSIASSTPAGNAPAASVDYIVTLQGRYPLDCSLLYADLRSLEKRIGRAIPSEGLAMDSAAWHHLSRLESAKVVRVGLQLVSRKGVVRSAEVDSFCSALDAISRDLGADISFPTIQVMDVARELDQFCSEVDIQIAIGVKSEAEGFSESQIDVFANARGFNLNRGGRYLKTDSGGREICSMQYSAGAELQSRDSCGHLIHSVTFGLDVPRSAGTGDAFDTCLALARNFAADFGGRLVDDRGIEIGIAGLDSVRGQLEPIFAAMHARGIPAGSPLALRLFD